MNNEFKIFNPYTKVETTVVVDDEHDTFHVIDEKIVNNNLLSELMVGNRWEPLLEDKKPVLKVVKKVKVKKVKRPAKTFGKNKNK